MLMGMVDDARNRVYGRFYAYEGVYPAMDILGGLSGCLDFRRAYTSINTALIRRSASPRRTSFSGVRRPRRSSNGPPWSWGSSSSMPTHRRPRVGSSGPSPLSRTGWSRRCGWRVSTLEEANRFLETYLPRFNAQFEREPREPKDLHRPLPKGFKLEEIFCLKTVRTILDGYTICRRGRRFAIEALARRMLGRPATVRLSFEGRLVIRYEGRDLGYREIAERPKRVPVVSVGWPKPPKYIPPPTLSWKVYQGPAESDVAGRS